MSRARPTLARRAFLGAAASAGLFAALSRHTARAAEERYLVVYWMKGGWDPAFVFDPHFESDVIHRDPSSTEASLGGLSFADAATRPSVRAFFNTWGAKTAFVNGIAVGSISHDGCTRLMLTSSRGTTSPDFATRIAHGTSLPHVVISGPRFPGDLGEVVLAVNSTLIGTADGTLPTPRNDDSEARIQAWLAAEAAELPASRRKDQYLDGLGRLPDLHEHAADFSGAISTNDADIFGTVADVLAAGLARSVMLEGSLPMFGNWDSHVSNDSLQDKAYEWGFARLAELMERLKTTAAPGGGVLADRTTVLVLSEMGRSPVLNSAQGKDHWPWTSAMLVGASVAGGRVLGGTDSGFAGENVDPVSGEVSATGEAITPASLAAGLLTAFDIDPTEAYPDVTPFTAPFQG